MLTHPRLDLRPGVHDPVVLLISRREIESEDPAEAVDRLHALFNTREAIWQYRGQMTLAVDGYNDDSRELVDVPEVCRFLTKLDQQWPYWAFFFNQVDDSIKLLASCLCASEHVGQGMVAMDPNALRQFLLRGFAAMNSLFDEHGFPEAECEAISNGVVQIIEQAFTDDGRG
jgi:hypothetical protein